MGNLHKVLSLHSSECVTFKCKCRLVIRDSFKYIVIYYQTWNMDETLGVILRLKISGKRTTLVLKWFLSELFF